MSRSWSARLASFAGAATIGLLSLTVTTGAAAAPAAPAPAGPAWTIQASPSQPGAIDSQLNSVSCLPGGTCTAVGSYFSDPSHEFALALQRTGSKWALEPTPAVSGASTTQLNGVSCTAANSCTAVGSTFKKKTVSAQVLAERWNGTTWVLEAAPTPGSAGLLAVSCPAPTFCLAVGGFAKNINAQEQPLAEEWNGASWRQVTVPNPHAENGSEFTSVDCAAVNRCEAAGDFDYADVAQKAFAESFNGTSWTAQKQVNPLGQEFNGDNSVSCTSPGACTSAGFWTSTGGLGLAERWNGTSWSRQAAPKPPKAVADQFTGVSCTAAAACTAVGTSSTSQTGSPSATMALTWNGTAWQLATTPTPAGGGALASVSCTSPSTCVAVGTAFGTVGTTLVEVTSG